MTLPLNVALTGPTLALTLAVSSVSLTLSSCSQPGIACRSTSGSFSASQTRCRGAGIRYSPVMSMGQVLPLSRPSGPRRRREPHHGDGAAASRNLVRGAVSEGRASPTAGRSRRRCGARTSPARPCASVAGRRGSRYARASGVPPSLRVRLAVARSEGDAMIGLGSDRVASYATLWDWRRQVTELYAKIRGTVDPEAAWRLWRDRRDRTLRRASADAARPGSRLRRPRLLSLQFAPPLRGRDRGAG